MNEKNVCVCVCVWEERSSVKDWSLLFSFLLENGRWALGGGERDDDGAHTTARGSRGRESEH